MKIEAEQATNNAADSLIMVDGPILKSIWPFH